MPGACPRPDRGDPAIHRNKERRTKVRRFYFRCRSCIRADPVKACLMASGRRTRISSGDLRSLFMMLPAGRSSSSPPSRSDKTRQWSIGESWWVLADVITCANRLCALAGLASASRLRSRAARWSGALRGKRSRVRHVVQDQTLALSLAGKSGAFGGNRMPWKGRRQQALIAIRDVARQLRGTTCLPSSKSADCR